MPTKNEEDKIKIQNSHSAFNISCQMNKFLAGCSKNGSENKALDTGLELRDVEVDQHTKTGSAERLGATITDKRWR